MARIHTSMGACPVCALPVRRTVHVGVPGATEVFRCATHGRLAYGLASVPLAALSA